MSNMNSEEREVLQEELSNIIGVPYEQFYECDALGRLILIKDAPKIDKISRALEIYCELLRYAIIDWGIPKGSESLVELENAINKIMRE